MVMYGGNAARALVNETEEEKWNSVTVLLM